LGERHNSGFKNLLDVHLLIFFLVILLNLKKTAKKWEKFTNFLKPQKYFLKNPGGWGFASRQWMA